ncbi:MAG: hypothetical protein A07HB70_02065 [uncultured archaeon A07HB70]|nr:MAG: hypothetical protein A07HB70_02065 [uncultured archaeon A07HB70]
MAPLSRAAFAAALVRRSRDELAAFVAAVERARGRSARVEDGVVVVDDGDGEWRLWVHDPGRLGSRTARFARALRRRAVDPPPDADGVVTPLRDPPASSDLPVVDADDLRDLALYGVPVAERDRLFRTHLGRSPTAAPDATTRSPALVAAGVVLAALVVVGLAAGVPPDVSGGVGERPTSPAADDTPAERYPPGLTEAGVADPQALGSAHEGALSNESYTLRSTRTVQTTDGDVRSRLSVTVQVDERRAFLARAETAGPAAPVFLGDPPARGVYWSNGTTYARRLTSDGERVYNTFDPVGRAGTWRYWTATVPFGGGRAGPAETYADLFGAAETRVVTTREPDGVRRYFVVGETLAPTGVEGSAVENAALEAAVTPSGVVQALSLAYEATVDGERVIVRWRVSYEAVGRTTVREPAWLDRALRGERTTANETANESDAVTTATPTSWHSASPTPVTASRAAYAP